MAHTKKTLRKTKSAQPRYWEDTKEEEWKPERTEIVLASPKNITEWLSTKRRKSKKGSKEKQESSETEDESVKPKKPRKQSSTEKDNIKQCTKKVMGQEMGLFKKGDLYSGSGKQVTNSRQAVAISLHVARKKCGQVQK